MDTALDMNLKCGGVPIEIASSRTHGRVSSFICFSRTLGSPFTLTRWCKGRLNDMDCRISMMLVRKDWEAYLDRVTELGLWRLEDFRGNLPSFSHMSAYLRSNDNGRSNLQLMDAMLKTQCKVGDALFKQFGDRVFQQFITGSCRSF